MKIRFCEHSPKGKNKLARRLAQEFPGLDVKVKGCCKQCKTCREAPMVMVDKELVVAESWDAVYLSVKAKVCVKKPDAA